MTLTDQQAVRFFRKLLTVMQETIEESAASPLGGIPSGELYSLVLGAFPSYTPKAHEAMLSALEQAGVIERSGQLLRPIKKARR